MPVYEPVELYIVVVFSEGVDEDLGHLQPSHVEAELEQSNIFTH